MNTEFFKAIGRKGGQAAVGERKGSAKLTTEAILEIRSTQGQRLTLALKHGIHPRSIDAIRRRQLWKHL